jgi:chemotaxis protein MotD
MPVSGFDPLAFSAPVPPTPPVREAADSAAGDKDQFNKLVDKISKTDKQPAETEQAAAGAAPVEAANSDKDAKADQAAAAEAAAAVAAPQAPVPPVVVPVVVVEEAAAVAPVAEEAAQAAAPALAAGDADVATALFGDGEMSLPTVTLNAAADAADAALAQAAAQAATLVAEETAPAQAPAAQPQVQGQAQPQVQAQAQPSAAAKPKADAKVTVEAQPVVDEVAAEAAPVQQPAQPVAAARPVAQAAPVAAVQVQQAAVTAAGTVPPVTLTAGLVTDGETSDVAAEAPAEDAPVNPLHVAATGEGEKLEAVVAPAQAGRARPADKQAGEIGPAEFSVLAAGSVNLAESTAETAPAKAAADVTVVDIVHRTGIEATNVAQAGAERPTVRLMPVLEQVRIGLARAVEGAPSKLSLELMPKNLGKVTIEVEAAKDGQLKASIQADNPAALEVLRKDAPQLERSLQEAGYKLDHQSLSFSLRDQSQGGKGEGNGQGRAQNATPENTLSPVVEDEAPVRRSRASMGRVDVTI